MKVNLKTSYIAILLAFLSLLNVVETYAEVTVQTDSTNTWEPSDSIFVHYLKEQGIPVTSHNQLKTSDQRQRKIQMSFRRYTKSQTPCTLGIFQFPQRFHCQRNVHIIGRKSQRRSEGTCHVRCIRKSFQQPPVTQTALADVE